MKVSVRAAEKQKESASDSVRKSASQHKAFPLPVLRVLSHTGDWLGTTRRMRSAHVPHGVMTATAAPSLPLFSSHLSRWRCASCSTLLASSPLTPLAAHFTAPSPPPPSEGRGGGSPGAEKGGAEVEEG